MIIVWAGKSRDNSSFWQEMMDHPAHLGDVCPKAQPKAKLLITRAHKKEESFLNFDLLVTPDWCCLLIIAEPVSHRVNSDPKY